jgi:hypothetical protein
MAVTRSSIVSPVSAVGARQTKASCPSVLTATAGGLSPYNELIAPPVGIGVLGFATMFNGRGFAASAFCAAVGTELRLLIAMYKSPRFFTLWAVRCFTGFPRLLATVAKVTHVKNANHPWCRY